MQFGRIWIGTLTSGWDVDPPKGNFPVRQSLHASPANCSARPNYHRYQQIVQQHHAARFARMPFDQYENASRRARSGGGQPVAGEDEEDRALHVEARRRGRAAVLFDNVEDARAHLLSAARDRVVKAVESARFHAKLIEPCRQARSPRDRGPARTAAPFPLDTANALRGRLRREGFTIFKRDRRASPTLRGQTQVPGARQSFAESIGALIGFIEANPMITVRNCR